MARVEFQPVPKRSAPETVVIRTAEYSGLIAGILGLLGGNIAFAVSGGLVAYVAYLIDRSR